MSPSTPHRPAVAALATVVAASVALTLTLVGGPIGAGPVAAARGGEPLTNLDHLEFLGDTVTPPDQARHTTFRLARQPAIEVPWTYADRQPDGSYRRVGGGTYDSATNTYSQGAFNADDVTRAAVVYLRHWQATGNPDSRDHAYQLLRAVTYLQTASGRDAGNVVLWMQPDGTLNPSPEPVEEPDPSDSDASYWLARTIWALGEGYAAFAATNKAADDGFAAFLRSRLELSIKAVDRQVLDRYGEHLRIDGEPAPAWLIVDGADATAEAMLGLAAYVEASGPRRARVALHRLAEGVAELSGGGVRSWPFDGVRPWVLSRSVWHAWASQMPAALARASTALGRPELAGVAARDSFTFDPWLLTSGGADNGRLPTRTDPVQIAYGTDSRLQSLLATGDVTGGRGAARGLAGMVASWYFGANPAGEPMYDPDTGRTYDGIAGDGTINLNSGAESTIHGLLSMLALDAHPAVAERARADTVVRRVGDLTLQAEDGRLGEQAQVVTPESTWTGESQFGGSGYVAIGKRGSVGLPLPRHRRSLVLPVFDLRPVGTVETAFRSDGRLLGRVDSTATGRQGDSPAPGALLPVTLPGMVSSDAERIRGTTVVADGARARLDGIVLRPLVSRLVVEGAGHATALLSSASSHAEIVWVRVPGTGPARVATYTGLGRPAGTAIVAGNPVRVRVPAGGLALVHR